MATKTGSNRGSHLWTFGRFMVLWCRRAKCCTITKLTNCVESISINVIFSCRVRVVKTEETLFKQHLVRIIAIICLNPILLRTYVTYYVQEGMCIIVGHTQVSRELSPCICLGRLTLHP